MNYQLAGWFTVNENDLAGDLHTNGVGDDPLAPGEGATWLSNESNGAWIQYKFDQIYTLANTWVWNFNQALETLCSIQNCTIEYSTTGIDWTQPGGTQTFAQADGSSNYAHNTEIAFSSVDAKYVRINVSGNHGGASAARRLPAARQDHRRQGLRP